MRYWELNRIRRYLGTGLSFLRSRLVTRKPFWLAHSATYACNSRCRTCTIWKMSRLAHRDMSTKRVFALLERAHAFGMRGYYLFGGEPLLRRDVPEILEHAKTLGFVTTINTNASLLEKKAESITNDLDFACVSIDYPDDHNDYIRGRRGAFREVIRGTKRLLELGKTRVTFVCTVSRLNLDKVEAMASLAQNLGVGISYNAVEPTWLSGYDTGRTESVVEENGLTDCELRDLYRELLKLKRRGYPLMESELVLRDYACRRPFKCHFPKIFVYVSPEGRIFPCTTRYGMAGANLDDISFEEYFSSRAYREPAKRMEKCNICVRTCVRMYAYSYSLHPLHMLGLAGSAPFRSFFSNHQGNRAEQWFQRELFE